VESHRAVRRRGSHTFYTFGSKMAVSLSLSNSMDQGPSWEADIYSACQTIPPPFTEPRWFITTLTRVSQETKPQPDEPNRIPLRCILILSSHLSLGLKAGLNNFSHNGDITAVRRSRDMRVHGPLVCTSRCSPRGMCPLVATAYTRPMFQVHYNFWWSCSNKHCKAYREVIKNK
jgi:hypothetical protein